MPVTVTHNFEQFGTFGIALSFVSWFTGMAFLLVVAAAVGPCLVEGNTAVARWLRAPMLNRSPTARHLPYQGRRGVFGSPTLSAAAPVGRASTRTLARPALVRSPQPENTHGVHAFARPEGDPCRIDHYRVSRFFG
jgi:hypothetical protein